MTIPAIAAIRMTTGRTSQKFSSSARNDCGEVSSATE